MASSATRKLAVALLIRVGSVLTRRTGSPQRSRIDWHTRKLRKQTHGACANGERAWLGGPKLGGRIVSVNRKCFCLGRKVCCRPCQCS
jgi:hypothetical protein